MDYVRTFCFLNLDNAQTPAVLIVLDNMTTARPEFGKYWQVNTLSPPETTADGVILRNSDFEVTGKVDLRMLRPEAGERNLQILSGKDANSVFGQFFTPPKPDRPEANGHRVLSSTAKAQASDLFLTVMSMSDEQEPEPPAGLAELSDEPFVPEYRLTWRRLITDIGAVHRGGGRGAAQQHPGAVYPDMAEENLASLCRRRPIRDTLAKQGHARPTFRI